MPVSPPQVWGGLLIHILLQECIFSTESIFKYCQSSPTILLQSVCSPYFETTPTLVNLLQKWRLRFPGTLDAFLLSPALNVGLRRKGLLTQ